jgi:photosystem II stability/assembly factor-like uncharacterized protein
MLARSCRLTVLLAIVALTTTASASAASLWTPVSSGTSGTISAIAYPNAAEIVLVTANGGILHLTAGGFAASTVTPAAPLGFTDVGMSPSGVDGVAVGPSGTIYRSADSGVTWTQVTGTQDYSAACSDGGTLGPLSDDLYSVHFADANTVYVTGNNGDVLKSTDAGAAFTEVNKISAGNNGACVADPDGAFTDSAWINASDGFLLSNEFGLYFATTNGFATAAKKGGENVNGFGVSDELALDPSDPSDAWGVSNYGSGASFFSYTTDGGNSWTSPTYDDMNVALNDIATAGGTVVTVGNGGDIYTSPNGVNFYRQIAAPPYSTTNWRAVAMLPGTSTAIVGGANGALVYTSAANRLPDTIPPTGTVSGPKTLAPKQYGTYRVSATDNPGGSGVNSASFVWSTPGQANQTGATATFAFPTAGTYTVTVSFGDLAGNSATASITIKVKASAPSGAGERKTTTGGGTVGIYKKVTVPKGSGKGRYIPIYLLDKTPRRFVITLLTVKRKHQKQKTLAKLTTLLKKGHADVHLRLPSSVKSGSYELEVRLYTTGKHAKAAGKRIKQLFVLD